MAVKDRELTTLLAKVRGEAKEVEIDGVRIKFARLTLNDNVEIDKKLGINLFAEMVEAAKSGGVPKVWSYELQRLVFFYSLCKTYPDIEEQEVGELMSLLSQEQLSSLLVWIITGKDTEGLPPLPQSG